MLNIKSFFLISISSIFLFACNTKKEINLVQEKEGIVIRKGFASSEPATVLDFVIDSAGISNNILVAKVSYIGHKSDVSFNLVWNGALLKSYPPKAVVFLEARLSEINGNKKVSHLLSFDLAEMLPMKGYDEVIVLLKNYKEGL